MAYQIKKYGGGGGGARFLSNLFGGGTTNKPNQPIESPGDAPFNYKGDPEDLVGKFAGKGGRISESPFSDKRNFLNKMFGAPNTAEQLNSQYALQKAEIPLTLQQEQGIQDIRGNQTLKTERGQKELNLEYADKEAKAKAKEAKMLYYASKGINPALIQEGDAFEQQAYNTHLETLKEQQAIAGASGAKARLEKVKTVETAPTELQRIVNDSSRAATVSGIQKKFAQDPQNAKFYSADEQARLMAGPASVSRALTMSVSPGEVTHRPGLFSDVGIPEMEGVGGRQFYGSHTVPGMENFGPVQDQHPTTLPGKIGPVMRGSIKDVIQQGINTPPLKQNNGPFSLLSKPQDVAPAPNTLGTPRMVNGQLQADLTYQETPEEKARREQLEAAGAWERIKKLLSQPDLNFNQYNR
jgi:hypothetical protein